MNMERSVSGAKRREGHEHGQTLMCTTGRDKTVTENTSTLKEVEKQMRRS